MYEFNRPTLEEHYPTHTLILFSQRADDKNYLFCYIDLFSTFQFYVLLNDNYVGKELYLTFYQTVSKQEKPQIDVRRIRTKHLQIFMEHYGIDRSEFSGSSIKELYGFVEQKFQSLNFSPVHDLQEKLSSSYSKLNYAFLLALYSNNQYNSQPPSSLQINIPECQIPAFLAEMQTYFDDDDKFNIEPFRRYFLEDNGNGGIEAMSTPGECSRETSSDEGMKLYGHTKFNQLMAFINNAEKKD